jgi:hypothetical protein
LREARVGGSVIAGDLTMDGSTFVGGNQTIREDDEVSDAE